ncbi:MAG: hypothetical protein JWO92_2293 [Chitinophagaceae bacterium]|nr:hypothetical protein [Chitinophagaceae bacterium]
MPKDNNITNSQEQNAATNQQAENQTQNMPGDNTVKNPDEWTTGNEPMTGAQKSYLKTLSDEAGEELNENLTKAEASKRIEELQHKTGRGLNKGVPNQANTGEPE